jgi:hypothetical protein
LKHDVKSPTSFAANHTLLLFQNRFVTDSRLFKDALNEMKRKAEVAIDNVSVDKKVNEDDIRAKLNELHYGFACSSEAEARFLVL